MNPRDMQEAKLFGFKTYQEYCQYRVSIKRTLRSRGIVFKNNASTLELIQLDKLSKEVLI